MHFTLLLILLSGLSPYSMAGDAAQIKINASLTVTRCDSKFANNGELQNCIEGKATEQVVTFNALESCDQGKERKACAVSAMLNASMDKGSANAIIVLGKDRNGRVLLTAMLTPGVRFMEQSTLNLDLGDLGGLVGPIKLTATSFSVEGEDYIYIPTLSLH